MPTDRRSLAGVCNCPQRGLNRSMRKTSLLQKTHLFRALGRIGGQTIEFLAPHFYRACGFILIQPNPDAGQRIAIDAVLL